MVELVHRKKDDWEQILTNPNIFIAIFTTVHSRIKLYHVLDRLQEQILYLDTDSVIYKWKTGLPEVELGDYLGDFTNELDEGDFIKEFVSAGPKNYGYETKNGKQCCKVSSLKTIAVDGS